VRHQVVTSRLFRLLRRNTLSRHEERSCALAPFFTGGVPCARFALTVVAAQDVGMWAPDGDGKIDCSGESRGSPRLRRGAD
jgi:hypothetical protein